MLQLVASQFSIDCAADGEPRRQITGLAVPWDTPTTDSTGTAVKFAKDSLPVDGRQPKLLEGHDPTQIRGVVTERVSTDDGMMFTAKIADTSAGRDAMQLLLMGAVDAVSVGVIPTKFHYDDDGTMIVEAASWNELSLVPFPAFDAARIATVAASAPEASKPTIESKEDSAMSTLEVVAASAPAVIPTEPIYAQPKREFKLPSIGEYMAAFVAGGHDFAVMNDNIRKFAAPDVTTGDLDGILPLPIVAPIYSGIQGLRPVCDAVGVRAMPASGKIFIVPKITTHTSIGGPATQNTTITAGQYIVTDIQVTKDIYGGYVDVSEASLDWTSPEVLQGLIEDMAKKYALATDNAAADALLAGTSQTTGNVAPTDPADWIAKVYACANTILHNGYYLPDHLFVSGDVFAQLGQLVDSQDRPLFPQVGPMNSFGSITPASREATVFGLRLVVDTNFADKTTIVGAAATGAFRVYEQQKGTVSIDNPSTLSRTIAFRGYFAPKMIDANQFMKIPQA